VGQAIPLMHAQVRGACARVIVFASAYVCFRPIPAVAAFDPLQTSEGPSAKATDEEANHV